VKIRGTAAHIAEKYLSLARDAMASGDTVMAESYLQHAEHYNRIIMAAQSQMGQHGGHQGESANGGGGGQFRPRWNPDAEPAEEGAAEADELDPRAGVNEMLNRGRREAQGQQHRGPNGGDPHARERDTNGADSADPLAADESSPDAAS
jgi:hypothetical protein